MRCTIAQLKDIAKELKLVASGNKAVLFACIHDCGNEYVLRGDNDNTFEYHKLKLAGHKEGPYWLVVNPEPVPSIPGINMKTGAKDGFFGPRNPNNSAGAEKHNFLTH